jgi:hypothetical protein
LGGGKPYLAATIVARKLAGEHLNADVQTGGIVSADV